MVLRPGPNLDKLQKAADDTFALIRNALSQEDKEILERYNPPEPDA